MRAFRTPIDSGRAFAGRPRGDRSGITWIEVLAAIAVVSLLISLLAPATQAAREAARQTTCRNHLRQIGVAVWNHESTSRHFPSNGWGYRWIGEPERGTDARQPGGWIYNLLLHLGQQALRELGSGGGLLEKRHALAQLVQTPLDVLQCPSRPSPDLGPANTDVTPFNCDWLPRVAKTDYAINEGDWISHTGAGPATLEEGDSPAYPWRDLSQATGISFQRSRVRPGDVTAGLSQTYLVGEKYVDRQSYDSAADLGYDQSMYSGVDLDLNRWTLETPIPGGEGQAVRSFGSAHAGGCHFVYCDGAVRQVSYGVDAEIHRRAGNRKAPPRP